MTDTADTPHLKLIRAADADTPILQAVRRAVDLDARSQDAICKAAGMQPCQLSLYLNEKRGLRASSLERLFVVLRITVRAPSGYPCAQ